MELQRTKDLTCAVIQYGHLRMDRSILEDVINKFYKLGSIRNTCITDVFDNKMGQRKDPQRTPDNTSNGCKETPFSTMVCIPALRYLFCPVQNIGIDTSCCKLSLY